MNELEQEILLNAEGDDPLGSLDGMGEHFEKEPAARKRMVLAAVESLLSQGLIMVGEFIEDEDGEVQWRAWSGSISERMQRLDEIYTPEVEDWESWGFSAWFAETETGKEVSQAIVDAMPDLPDTDWD